MNHVIQPAVAPTVTEQGETRRSPALRLFQVASALTGAALFLVGLAAVFEVDFNANLLDQTAEVGGYGFSAAAAIAAILLGGAILVSTVADQDRGGAALVGLITIGVGIAALVADGQASPDVRVDRASVSLFIVAGAVVFLCSLVPWWTRRRVVTTVR